MDIRLTISSKDIMRITGKGMRYANRRMQLIRAAFNKSDKAEITIKEYCEYETINIDEVKTFLGVK